MKPHNVKRAKHISTEVAYFLTQPYIYWFLLLGFISNHATIVSAMIWLACIFGIIIIIYTIDAYISGFILICPIVLRDFFYHMPSWFGSLICFQLSPHSSLNLLFFWKFNRVHYENFVPCYVHKMLKRIRPADCVTEKVLQILLWDSWCADSQLFSQTIVLPLIFDLSTSRFS